MNTAAEYPLPGEGMSVNASPPLTAGGGPQFGAMPPPQKSDVESDKGAKTRFPVAIFQKKNIRPFVIALAVIILSALWVYSRRPSPSLMHLSNQTRALTGGASQSTITKAGAQGVTLELKSDGITAEIPSDQINIITEQAQPGNGVTHLARRALAERMQNESISLSPQQRIYAEDFTQKAMDVNTTLRVGQKLSFPTELLDKAIQKAQGLTSRQLQNLSRYTAYVNFQ